MKNIHVLPTDKPSRLSQNKEGLHIFEKGISYKAVNIYITSDEEIKKDEYYLGEDNNIYCLVTTVNFNGKKIILTDNKDLIKDGLQSIPEEFLEWFVKNPSCEEVEVKKLFKANPKYNEGTRLTEKVGYWEYKIIIPKETFKQKTKDRIMSETSEETKQKARDYGNSLIKQDRTCTHNCSAVCGECQILEPKPLLSVDWLLRYIEGLAKKGYNFMPSSNKEIVEHVKQMEKDNMINFLKSVFQQDGFDYEKAYNNFLKQQI